ncbi:MAG: 2-phosphosulfolactate phosphatase [Bacteroidales bacterium]|jgi:2-phosphosulfolactate phosphatase|nr:2-phosphosulfolactate phosphatase [Bacteroidales bacterium]
MSISPKIEVVLSPDLYKYYQNNSSVVVVVDVLRATTAICTAFANGAQSLIPVASVDEAKEYKAKGYVVAAERDGSVLDFADFGNSPFNFTKDRVTESTIVYSTTNGTRCIDMANNAKQVLIGSFLNVAAIAEAASLNNDNVIVLCAGWKGKFNIEDTLFAGALTNILKSKGYVADDDSAKASEDLWLLAKDNLIDYAKKVSQLKRLKSFGLDDVFEHCFNVDYTNSVPVLSGNTLVLFNEMQKNV